MTFTSVSRAPLAKIEAYKKRMGWSFPWVSSRQRFQFRLSCFVHPEEIAKGEAYYNYQPGRAIAGSEEEGISVFYKDGRGQVFHTYSCYERGIDMVNGAYRYLDLVPKGRDEDGLNYPMEWLRRHDQY
ncbi:hypothetical protein AJ87_10140 [Rhizobium yanglingense]|nr:hypothetical protein AJ87_10140 [Rhizobium yanglingense]